MATTNPFASAPQNPTNPFQKAPLTVGQQALPSQTFNFGTPTPTGGMTFTPPPTVTAPAATPPKSTVVAPTPSGGSITTTAAGNPVGYTPAPQFNIATGGAVPSDAFASTMNTADLLQKRNQYQDYVHGLAQAQTVSPDSDYYKALQAQQNVMLKNMGIATDYYTNPDAIFGATTDQAATAYNRQTALGGLAQQQATNALGLQQTIRQGNIDAAKTLVTAAQPSTVSPGSSLVSPLNGDTTFGGAGAYSDYQAQQTYFNLAQNFPDAQIPAYNPQYTAQQNLQIAQQAASQSPSFQSRNIVSVQLPGGGIGYVNKNQIVTDPKSGIATIISPANATAANSYSANIKDLSNQLSNTQRAIDTAESNFPLLLSVVKKAGVNDYNSPLGNQLQQALNNRLIGSGDYASYNALLTSLQTEYSQILSRGGSVTDKTRGEAEQIVNGNIGYNALNDLYTTLKAESGNVIKGYNDQISQQNGFLNQIYSSGQSLSSGGGTQPTTSGGSSSIGNSWANI